MIARGTVIGMLARICVRPKCRALPYRFNKIVKVQASAPVINFKTIPKRTSGLYRYSAQQSSPKSVKKKTDLLTSLVLRFSGPIAVNVSTDVAVNDMSMHALRKMKDLEEGILWIGEAFLTVLQPPLVVIQGNLAAVRYRDQIVQPHAIPRIRRRNLPLQ